MTDPVPPAQVSVGGGEPTLTVTEGPRKAVTEYRRTWRTPCDPPTTEAVQP